MTALIARTRTLIADVGSPPVFIDDQIQDTLDLRRIEQRHVPLRPDPTFLPGGAVQYKDFYADTQAWESDVLLQDTSFATVTPTLSEELVGHWQFATQPQSFAVRATGKTYDLYGSAADLLEAWAAQVMLEFNVTESGRAYNRQGKFEQLNSLAAQYRGRAMAQQSRITQGDAVPAHVGGGVVYPDYGAADDWS
jgi:hypothetical protein